jgi:hypothetical protein
MGQGKSPQPHNKAAQADHLNQRLSTLQQQLDAIREQLDAHRGLLESLPEIFERRFEQRLKPMLGHRERLLAENTLLRQQLLQAPAPDAEAPALAPVEAAPPAREGLGGALRHALGLGPAPP